MLDDIKARQLADRLFLDYLELDDITDELFLMDSLPESIIRNHRVLPIKCDDKRIFIATDNPHDKEIHNQVSFYFHQVIVIKIVASEKLTARMASLLHNKEQAGLDDEASIVNYVEKLFLDAVNKNATDIHIECFEKQIRIRLRIDGILYEEATLSNQLAPRLIAHLKVLAELDITEKRLPQDGRLQIVLSNQAPLDCRISSCPTVYGEKLVLRLLNLSQVSLSLDALGFSEDEKNIFISTIKKPQGLILVTGPTGSGKTVTLYTALKLLNQVGINICSVEDPVEIILNGINQVPINYQIDLTFSKVLRAFLRQDPDIIMVGEMRDKETAEIAVKASQTGHLVLSTLHTNSAVESLTRLIHMGIPSYHLAASLNLIIAQRLVRLLCNHCKSIDEHQHGLMFKSYRANGCAKCQQGYRGRTAIYELLRVSKTISEIIVNSPDVSLLEKQAREEGMQTLYESGLEKVKAGITSFSELLRVTSH